MGYNFQSQTMRVFIVLAVALIAVTAQKATDTKEKKVTVCIEPDYKTANPISVEKQSEEQVQKLVKDVNEKIQKLNKERAKQRDIEPEQLTLDVLKERFSKDLVNKLKKIQEKASRK